MNLHLIFLEKNKSDFPSLLCALQPFLFDLKEHIQAFILYINKGRFYSHHPLRSLDSSKYVVCLFIVACRQRLG